MSEKIKLTAEIVEQLYRHGAAGRSARDKGDLTLAEIEFLKAWEMIPEPKHDHDYSQSIIYGLVLFFRDTNQLEKARVWLVRMAESYGPEDLFFNFVKATVAFESQDFDSAFEIFDAQYKAYKKRPFSGEDPKYLRFYLDRVKSR